MTYNEVVSRIQQNLNSLNKDMYIPKRFILSVVKSKGEFLISQKFNDKSIFRETNLFKWVNCIELEEVDTVKCGRIELSKCSSAMVSKKKLPKLVWSRYGSSILMITNITGDKEYKLITPSEYVNMKNGKYFEKFKGKYAIVYPDGKLAIPDSTVKMVNVLLYTLDDDSDDVSTCSESDECSNVWDKELNIPEKLREVAIQEAFREISVRVQTMPDENPNNDSAIRSREQ